MNKLRKLLRFPELKGTRGIHFSRRHLLRLEDKGTFPKRVQMSENAVGWVEEEIDQYVADRIRARDHGMGQ